MLSNRKWSFSLVLLMMCAAVAYAVPADLTINFDPPIVDATHGPAVGYRFYIDDCAATGPVAAPFAEVVPGQTFVGAITVEGDYQMCVRAYNAAGEKQDPGAASLSVPIYILYPPGDVQNLSITIQCTGSGYCVSTISAN